ncbi:hypothetical protein PAPPERLAPAPP_00310 [Brevundimonas phage vB_BpoS-Papperlapapp]|uniref:Uncharacterized protein n=2 Tax=Marchewkavirus TaxID=3425052 RepID=A0A9E7MPZ4_9CAUD|nr:hypothetical protein KABACHOK_04510 [Brevundimonas phage vB_BpoS-Kabachok]USN14958.1 hypothetical protein DOMOVOI_05080 [Brevundimonas phage vB_BpoS-Domovoi]USN15773.1 hypothetical protein PAPPERLAPAPP_00310 [Brevundimonas phage vB_BpoS-Papperlapapp]
MATERVYHPETCEPFDVPSAKAGSLVLQHGWSRTPWTRVEVAPPVEIVVDAVEALIVQAEPEDAQEAPRGRGRGRQRRTVEADLDAPDVVDDADGSWRS